MIMAQILMFHTDHLHFTQTQTQQQTLKSFEIQPVPLAVAPEQLLDVEVLLHLEGVSLGPHGLWGHSGSPHVGSLRNLQIAVCVQVIGMLMSTVLMAMIFCMTVVALVEEEGEHAQETELGVDVDSHCPLTSDPLQKSSTPSDFKLLIRSNLTLELLNVTS